MTFPKAFRFEAEEWPGKSGICSKWWEFGKNLRNFEVVMFELYF